MNINLDGSPSDEEEKRALAYNEALRRKRNPPEPALSDEDRQALAQNELLWKGRSGPETQNELVQRLQSRPDYRKALAAMPGTEKLVEAVDALHPASGPAPMRMGPMEISGKAPASPQAALVDPESPVVPAARIPEAPAAGPQPTRAPAPSRASGLIDAQRQASENTLFANLARAGSGVGAALSTGTDPTTHRVVQNAPVDEKGLEALSAGANAPIEAYGQQQAEQDRLKKADAVRAAVDPTSPENVRARAKFAGMIPGIEKRPGFNLLTAADFPEYLQSEKLRGELDDKAKQDANRVRDDKRADLSLAEDTLHHRNMESATRTGAASGLAGTRRDALSARLAASMTRQLDEGQWHGPAAAQVLARNQAVHLLSLAKDSGGNIMNLSGPEQEELAMGFAKLIAGGHGTEGEVKTLVPPKTLQSGRAGIKEWLLNEPQGRNQVEFVKRMAHSVERQKGVADQIISEEKAKRAGSFRKLQELDPEQHAAVLHEMGMDPANFDEHGAYRTPKGAGVAAGPHGASVTQNGVTYHWNPQTGEYE